MNERENERQGNTSSINGDELLDRVERSTPYPSSE
jgi:hypothetical protein